MLSLSLTSSVPLKSTLSNSKAPSQYKLRPTTYGHHPQSWIATFNIPARSTRYTTTNTLRYCSCRSSCSFNAVFILVCNDISSSVCNNVFKSSATSLNCALNNSTCINTPGSITRPTAGSFILSKSNTALCNKPYAIVGSLGLTATGRFILFWSRITGIVRGSLCSRQAATLATARASDRSVNVFFDIELSSNASIDPVVSPQNLSAPVWIIYIYSTNSGVSLLTDYYSPYWLLKLSLKFRSCPRHNRKPMVRNLCNLKSKRLQYQALHHCLNNSNSLQ